MKPVFLFWNLKWRSYRTIVLPSFYLATRLNSQNTNETEFINDHCHINLFMNIGVTIGIIEVSTSRNFFFTLFHFLTRLFTSKHLKRFSTYLVGRMERCDKNVLFSSSKFEKKNQLEHKIQVRNRLFFTVRSSSMKIIPFITWWAHKRQTFTLISIKIMRI